MFARTIFQRQKNRFHYLTRNNEKRWRTIVLLRWLADRQTGRQAGWEWLGAESIHTNKTIENDASIPFRFSLSSQSIKIAMGMQTKDVSGEIEKRTQNAEQHTA